MLTRHKFHYALLVSLFAVIAGGVLVTEFERGVANSNIDTLPDGVWWAVTTVSTVGYGDHFPVTAAGRGVATVLMILGIGLFGVLAASLASFFVEQRQEETVQRELVAIRTALERIEQSLAGS